MMLVRTYVAPSPIQGMGVFADQQIEIGQLVWRLDERFDRVWSDTLFQHLPVEARRHMERFASWDEGRRIWLYCVDDARFFNHSDEPNVLDRDMRSRAGRRINQGEELTCRYSVWAQQKLLNLSQINYDK